VRLWTRAIRPPNGDELIPNDNAPESVPPATVGPPSARPGDARGVLVEEGGGGVPPVPVMRAAPWSGWPAEWNTPNWDGFVQRLTDTAWFCVDLNASVLATMPPYLVEAPPTLDAGWLQNPDPDVYTSWEEFAKQLFWDFQLGEAFVIATARYSTGWPARFHVVPPWAFDVDVIEGVRRYTIGGIDVTADVLHIRYSSTVDDARGHGPLEAGAGRVIAAEVFARYASNIAAAGGVPPSVLEHPEELTGEQAAELQAQWVNARVSALGLPAVLSGGVTWKPTVVSPAEMALLDLSQYNDSRIATLLGVPPFLAGLPGSGDSMTYANATSLFDFHWRAGLKPKASAVMGALSGWALPRGTTVEVNRDSYVAPPPLQRAQTAQILNGIVDAEGNPALTVDEIRAVERLDAGVSSDPTVSGVAA
jgi:HK97 family phage portal protein